MFPAHVFRRYDVRGRAGEEITGELARDVGRALGTRIRRAGGVGRAAVGHDVRPSSWELAAGAAEGLAAAGVAAELLGPVPTPVVYHALLRGGLGGALVVTGSHNPRGDNGFKLCLGGLPLDGEGLQELARSIRARDFASGRAEIEPRDPLPGYLDELCARFAFSRPLRVAVDCGNGVAGPLVLEALERLGLRALPIHCEPDGTFPNHLPDPEVPRYMEDLRRLVLDGGADCGLGFDGDGDRVGVFDETGRKIAADWLVALFARDLLARHPGGRVRFDVKCSDVLAEDVRRHGGVPWMGATGHSILKRDVVAGDALLGGELSGHIVFNRGWYPIDDALYAALSFLRLVHDSGGPGSALFADLPARASTPEVKLPCPEQAKAGAVAALTDRLRGHGELSEVDGARLRLGQGRWLLVRASHTTANLTARLEAPDESGLRALRDLLLDALTAVPEVDAQPLHAAVPG